MQKIDRTELIELIYAAGLDPNEWQAVIQFMNDAFPVGAIAFQHIDFDAKVPAVCLTENWQDGAMEAYVTRYAKISPWLAAHQSARVGVAYRSDDICPSSSYDKSEFFSDFVRPFDVMCGAVAVKVFDDARAATTLGINYPEHLGRRASEPIARVLDDIAPHLQRSIHISRLLQQAEGHARSLEGLLDAMIDPALLVDRAGVVEYANSKAVGVLGRRRGMSLSRAGEIVLETAEETGQLRQLIRNAVQFEPRVPRAGDEALKFTVKDEPGPNVLFVAPLIADVDFSRAGWATPSARRVLITARYRHDQTGVDATRVATVFSLTPAEARVAAGLAGGRTVAEHAESTGRSVHTVRRQVKSILAKTECRSQSELVALVLRTVGGMH